MSVELSNEPFVILDHKEFFIRAGYVNFCVVEMQNTL